MIVKLQIPISPTFDFSLFLAEPTDVREWNLKGLPSDAFSVENGVLVTRGRRWPLMVDPQVSYDEKHSPGSVIFLFKILISILGRLKQTSGSKI